MKITYRHGYYGDVEYNLIDARLRTDKPYPYFALTVEDKIPLALYATSFYYEKGKHVFDCPENF